MTAVPAPDASESPRYRDILDSLVDMIFCKSPSYRVTFANRATQQYYRLSEAELRGLTDVPYNQLDFTQQYLRDDRMVFETGQPVVREEEPNVAPDGAIHYFHTIKTPIFDENGKVSGLVGHSRDVTRLREERRKAERARAHLELALEAGRMGTWEWDIENNRVYWSPQEERLYGIPEGSFTGTVDDYRKRIHPDDAQMSWERVRTALESRAESHHVLHRILWPDESVRWLDSHARFVYAEDGRPLRLVGISVDVTERMQAHEELKRHADTTDAARQELLRILEQAPAMISITRMPDGRITFQNALSRAVVGGRSFVGLTAHDIFPNDEQLKPFLDIQQEVYRTGKPFQGEQLPLKLDLDGDGVPEERYFNVMYQALRNARGEPDAVMSFSVEVTDQVLARRAVEEQAAELARTARALAESNRDLDQFAYVASHDLKAPLRGIANLAQWIEEDAGALLPAESRSHLELLKGRVHRMEALIDGILAYSRAGKHASGGRPLRTDPADVVREVIELLDVKEPARVEIVRELPAITTERVPLQQVFLNLIGNALRHAKRADALVRVSARDIGRFVEFAVSDNGPGIAPEFHERVWGIFQTLEARDDVEGTGIGLAVVKKLVEARGGSVALESRPGEGATFRFSWPKDARPKLPLEPS